MSLVEFRDVYKRYQMGEITINAVDGISFSVEEGEFAVVVGASGAGKTTVLNILGGMDSCTEGEIIVGGRNVSRLSDRQLIEYRRYDIGFVFQFYNLVHNLTAKERLQRRMSSLQPRFAATRWTAKRRSRASVCSNERTISRRSSRAANSSESVSHARSQRIPSCCSVTSPQAHSITTRADRFSRCCRIPATGRR